MKQDFKPLLPVDIVLHPSWWHHNAGIIFDRDFFYNPARRVEAEQKMEQVLYERWGRYGIGDSRTGRLPIIGPVHLAAGYIIPNILGCAVEYQEDASPQVIPLQCDSLEIGVEQAFQSQAFQDFEKLTGQLKKKYGYLTGDINWGGILNTALDVRGQNLFLDMIDRPEDVHTYFDRIAEVIQIFITRIFSETTSTSISVNRNIRNLKHTIHLHSECSHTMISTADYERFLLKYDMQWSEVFHPYGIHYCGTDPHRYAGSFAKLNNLMFLDVGWGGDLRVLRQALPRTFLNIRLSPVELTNQTPDEIRNHIIRLVEDSGNPALTGVCCINIDEHVMDDRIDAIFETAKELRDKYKRDSRS